MGYGELFYDELQDTSLVNCLDRKKSICNSGLSPFHYLDRVTLQDSSEDKQTLEDLSLTILNFHSSNHSNSLKKKKTDPFTNA